MAEWPKAPVRQIDPPPRRGPEPHPPQYYTKAPTPPDSDPTEPVSSGLHRERVPLDRGSGPEDGSFRSRSDRDRSDRAPLRGARSGGWEGPIGIGREDGRGEDRINPFLRLLFLECGGRIIVVLQSIVPNKMR